MATTFDSGLFGSGGATPTDVSDIAGYATSAAASATSASASAASATTSAASAAAAVGISYVLPTASTSVLGGVMVDGTTVTISGGVLSAVGGGGGSGVPASVAPLMDGVAAVGVGTRYAREDHVHPSDTSRMVGSNNLSELTVPATARTALGLGTIATQAASAVSITGGTATLSSASVSGTFTATTYAGLPVASTVTSGTSKVDGTTITISLGVISAAAQAWTTITGKPTFATVATTGAYSDLSGTPAAYSLPTASTTVLGGVKIDGTSIKITAGVISGNSKGNATVNWAGGNLVAAGTYLFTFSAPFALTVNSMDYTVGTVGSTSFAANVQIVSSGVATSITGLSAVSVTSSTKANTTATAANVAALGDSLRVVITSVTGSPTDAALCLNFTRN